MSHDIQCYGRQTLTQIALYRIRDGNAKQFTTTLSTKTRQTSVGVKYLTTS
jgi:hypothetical protein